MARFSRLFFGLIFLAHCTVHGGWSVRYTHLEAMMDNIRQQYPQSASQIRLHTYASAMCFAHPTVKAAQLHSAVTHSISLSSIAIVLPAWAIIIPRFSFLDLPHLIPTQLSFVSRAVFLPPPR